MKTMKTSVHFKTSSKRFLLVIAVVLTSVLSFAQTTDSLYEIPELIFRNPTLLSGTAGKEGAIYKFANVAPGIDGRIRLKKFSTSSIIVANIDNSSYGFDKAFQPEFGINPVKKNMNWYIDFELSFWNAGTNTMRKIDKFTLTSLDVDGDNVNVKEYVMMEKATSVTYSNISYLGNGGIVPPLPTCDNCGKQSAPIICTLCLGKGVIKSGGKNKKCTKCDGVGQVYSLCGHPFDGQDALVQGPTDNFSNIDTAATGVMATYIYNNKDAVNFRIGAKSGNQDGGAGIRLNSMWFKGFNLAPAVALPVKLNSFAAMYDRSNVNLSWAGTEEKFSHYTLQRSTDGKTYADIAVIFPSETTSSNSNYSYKDVNVNSATGSVFYRLVMIDLTNEAKYSDIRVIRLGKEKETLQITTYPNPVVEQVRISLPAAWQGKRVILEMYSSNGVKLQSKQLDNANQTESMQMGNVAKGFYLVKASCNGQFAQQQIIKN